MLGWEVGAGAGRPMEVAMGETDTGRAVQISWLAQQAWKSELWHGDMSPELAWESGEEAGIRAPVFPKHRSWAPPPPLNQ